MPKSELALIEADLAKLPRLGLERWGRDPTGRYRKWRAVLERRRAELEARLEAEDAEN